MLYDYTVFSNISTSVNKTRIKGTQSETKSRPHFDTNEVDFDFSLSLKRETRKIGSNLFLDTAYIVTL